MRLPISISQESREPIYHQIEMQIKSLIIGQHLQPGDVLPSIRALASDLSCSVITTRRAYQNLENEGYIKTIQGKGTFVRAIGTDKQQELKEMVIADLIVQAIERGFQLGCSEEELRAIFEKVLRETRTESEKR